MSTAPITGRAERSSAATRWRLDPAGSRAEFRVPHFWGFVTVKGHFSGLDGWLDVDENGQREIELTIDATSVHTGNPMRDRHLRASDFFDAEHNPEVRFHSTSVSDPGDGPLCVEGELVAAGHRVALSLEPTLQQSDVQLRIDASAVLDQHQLGMTWSPLGMTRTPVTLHVHALLRRER
ncbi:MAG: YceI family protein [Solirubrobacteraceae bacterium]